MAQTSVLNSLLNSAKGFGTLPFMRQISLLVGLSISVAIGVGLFKWSHEPNYRPLYGHLSAKELSGVLDVLDQSNIKYKLDNSSNVLSVPTNKISIIRLKLAAAGLPKGASVGFEFLEKESGLTTSRFLETVRYRRALEGELARTILNMSGVEGVRIHLAMPRESVFIDDKQQATASVLLDLDETDRFNKSNISAITRLVASGIPGLTSQNVTVVDQRGRLLTLGGDSDGLMQTKEEFEYKRKLESVYERRIESILIPLLGANKVRAKVAADIDFTRIEKTQENFNPDTVIRSEETFVETAADKTNVSGVPGATSNRPPLRGGLAQKSGQEAELAASRKQSTRNYEVAKTVSHTVVASGVVQRLSVAVLVDDYSKVDPNTGKVFRTSVPTGELDKITTLVKNVVGFNLSRGDEISVINSTFAAVDVLTELPPVSLMQQPWFWSTIKIGLSSIGILLLIIFVLRPVLKMLVVRSEEERQQVVALPAGMQAAGMAPVIAQGGAMVNPAAQFGSTMHQAMQGGAPAPTLQNIQQMADQDPERIAQVMKKWVGD